MTPQQPSNIFIFEKVLIPAEFILADERRTSYYDDN